MCTVVSPQASSLSVTQQPAQGTGALTYSSFNGVFQYTPPALNQTDWDAAYAWGDHSQVGYLTSFTETDPTVPAHVKGITQANITAWNAKSDVASLNDLSDVDTTGAANNKILKHNGTQWVVADDQEGADGNTTYSLEALLSPGIKLTGSDSTNDSVFFDAGTGITITRKTAPGASGGGEIEFACSTFTGTAVGLVPASTSGETTKFLKSDGSWDTAGGSITVFDETTELSTGATTLKFTGGMVSATGTDATKTITIAQPTLEIADGSTASQKKIKLGRGTDADDEIILSQGSYIPVSYTHLRAHET